MALTEIPPWIKRVLVMEDNYIIALEAEDILRSLGIEHVEIASDTAEANRLIEAQSFDFALLDVNLGNETSFDFAGLLLARGVAFGFVSGYGDDSVFPVALRDIPRISKPFNETSMGSLLASAA
ncbi:response regulator [Pararhizobium sp. BT-229]|uniref:response regulator n=1 Tax=Pararhizobium sp. BT-229 TaxID=2986923 RepID=UPI0021F6EFDE|nr:response regulator [Pararhizobium sp. BT-229]MCV9961542.1 response regulator [Pararhizobium sp. BT-229]